VILLDQPQKNSSQEKGDQPKTWLLTQSKVLRL